MDDEPNAARVAGGDAELVPDPEHPGSWILYVASVAQSYVDTLAPRRLHFEYVRKIAAVCDAVGRAGAPVRALHLGAGALTLPRYLAAARPGSRQLVVDRDAALLDFVLTRLPLPRGGGVTVEAADAREAVEAASAGSYDLVVGDVYDGAAMPSHVVGTEFAAAVHRVLAPGGVYVLNVTDLPVLTFSRRMAATLGEVFGDVCLIGEPGMLRGRRFGNLVFAAAAERLPAGVLTSYGRRGVVHDAGLRRFVSGARPFTDATAERSPG